MTTFVLKIIACIAMLIDHVTDVFLRSGVPIWSLDFSWATPEMIRDSILWTLGRGIGRIAFPIFAFLIVEGLIHTRDKKKYALRLLIAALVSEIPFDLMEHKKMFFWGKQNVMWTLLLGFLAIFIIDYVKKKYPGDMLKYNLFSCLSIFVGGILAMFLETDYNLYGVIVIISFYMLRGRKILLPIMLFVLTWLLYGGIQYGAMLAIPFLLLYNGKKGKDDRHLFYIFYPAHMLLIGLLVCFVL